MEHPKDIGDRTTLAVMLALRERGYGILVPFGENTRYDLVIDDGNQLSRVQCKTGRLRQGAVRFAVCSCYGHHLRPGEARRDYQGQVDYFGVHCPETAKVYLVPITHLTVRVQAALRVDPARNGQRSKIRDAADYEIGRVTVSSASLGGVNELVA
ncbi:MAG TPA: group I intron-associated PD-(D/E)XK endonuclease [Gaiellaceae bacterium]